MKYFKEAVLTQLRAKDIRELKRILNEANELDIINVMDELSNEELVLAYRLLNKDLALEVFEGLDLNDQQKLLNSFTEEAAIELIKELAPNDRVRLLDELPAAVAKRMIAALPPGDRADTNLIMGYEPETAGRIMTTAYVRIRREWTVAETLEKLRTIANEKEMIYTLYVTDNTKKLEGVLSLRELLIADEFALIETVMNHDPVKVDTHTDQEEVAKTLQKLDLLAIPVVDREGRLVGIITVDDAMDILEDEATEDMLNSAGLTGSDVATSETIRSATLVEGSLLKIWKARIPFLFWTLGAGVLSGTVIGSFEETLGAIPMIAMFIPVIMDMGGTIGNQSSVIFTRGMILGHIELSKIWKHIFKEVRVGFSLSLIMGTLTGTISYFLTDTPQLGLAVALSLMFAMTLASFLGFAIPFVLYKLKMDQAAGMGPLITSIKDITGLTIYFLLTSWLLSSLLYG